MSVVDRMQWVMRALPYGRYIEHIVHVQPSLVTSNGLTYCGFTFHFIAKSHKTLHWRDVQKYLVGSLKNSQLSMSLICITLLSTLGSQHPLSDEHKFLLCVLHQIKSQYSLLTHLIPIQGHDVHLHPYKASYGVMPIVA